MPWRSFGTGHNGVTPIEKVDQTTKWNDIFFAQAIGATTLTAPVVVDERTINVASVASISIGDNVRLLYKNGPKDYWYSGARVVSINVLEVTLDKINGYPFPIVDTTVVSATYNMSVLGTPAAPQIFSIDATPLGEDFQGDLTRIMMGMKTVSPVGLNTFGDLPVLTYPVYMRQRLNGFYDNKWSAYDNFDLGLTGYDLRPYEAINPAQGQDGFNWRFSMNGDEKHGAVTRITGSNIILDIVIQSDLTGIPLFNALSAGHEVD